ncbi:phosphoglycolate phosphatase [Salirhabdus euzebyi]|uniref:Phosphoglycolate phosphatase n=1 Tax=Salirhabdus euzebyi TaxID=394506 RepID=A0A841Q449_9BACI|nr:HAD-IA family hydrolase [Salirhabdus euzebyi]MBB6453167.1 phosphoglycolate phosphatase [Salirhabdus euzebyi]
MNILWDFDGTLFDTYPAYTKMFKQVLGDQVNSEKIYEQLKISFSHAIRFFNLTEKQIEEMDQLKNNIHPSEMIPFEGVEEVLQFANKNVIMTHKDRKGVMGILDHYGWVNYFADIVTSDHGFPRKPHTAAYDYLHQNHHIDLAIGDRELDLIPAKDLGIQTCIFQNEQINADYYLSNYHDFFKVVVEK